MKFDSDVSDWDSQSNFVSKYFQPVDKSRGIPVMRSLTFPWYFKADESRLFYHLWITQFNRWMGRKQKNTISLVCSVGNHLVFIVYPLESFASNLTEWKSRSNQETHEFLNEWKSLRRVFRVEISSKKIFVLFLVWKIKSFCFRSFIRPATSATLPVKTYVFCALTFHSVHNSFYLLTWKQWKQPEQTFSFVLSKSFEC